MAKAKKLPSGNWRVLVFTGYDENKKRKYKSFTHENKKEAEFLAAEYIAKNDFKSSQPMLTFAQAMSQYIQGKSNILSPSTILNYKRLMNQKFQALNEKNIYDITQDDIQQYINQESVGHSPKTVRNIHGLITAVFATYRPDFVLRTTLPQKRKHEIMIPTEDNIKEIYRYVKGTEMELPFLLASQLGLRASEIAGLTKECIDIKHDTITINQARVASESGTSLKTPKSYSGFRTLECDHQLCLKALNAPGNFVVSLSSSQISRRWHTVIRKIPNVPIFNFHALRHYFASKALLQNIPQKYIAEMMGHASLNLLNEVYQHTFSNKKQEYGKLMASLTQDVMQHEMQHEKEKNR